MNNNNFEPQTGDQEVNPAAEKWGVLPEVGDILGGAEVLAVGGVENPDPQSQEYMKEIESEYANGPAEGSVIIPNGSQESPVEIPEAYIDDALEESE